MTTRKKKAPAAGTPYSEQANPQEKDPATESAENTAEKSKHNSDCENNLADEEPPEGSACDFK